MLHDKAKDVSTRVAAETIENLFFCADRKGGRFFSMKRTQSFIITPGFFENNTIAHDLHDIGGVFNLIDCIFGDCPCQMQFSNQNNGLGSRYSEWHADFVASLFHGSHWQCILECRRASQ